MSWADCANMRYAQIVMGPAGSGKVILRDWFFTTSSSFSWKGLFVPLSNWVETQSDKTQVEDKV